MLREWKANRLIEIIIILFTERQFISKLCFYNIFNSREQIVFISIDHVPKNKYNLIKNYNQPGTEKDAFILYSSFSPTSLHTKNRNAKPDALLTLYSYNITPSVSSCKCVCECVWFNTIVCIWSLVVTHRSQWSIWINNVLFANCTHFCVCICVWVF